MSFLKTRNKIKKVLNQSLELSYDITKQITTNKEIDSEINRTNHLYNLHRKIREIGDEDWVTLSNSASFTGALRSIEVSTSWEIELERIHPNFLDNIKVEFLVRTIPENYRTTLPEGVELVDVALYENYFFEIEDIVGENTLKNVKLHAYLRVVNYTSGDIEIDIEEPVYQTKLIARLKPILNVL